MSKGRFILLLLLLLPELFLGFQRGLWALNSSEAESKGNSGNALIRLIEISTQLSNLNARLQNELQDSRRSSRELQTMLETSRKELEGLKQELGTLKQELEALSSTSAELSIKAENSQMELNVLQEVLKKAESSLMSLELSFNAYRDTAQAKISSLEKENRLWRWGCIAAGILAAGIGTAFMIGR